jgi:hypothetical protein
VLTRQHAGLTPGSLLAFAIVAVAWFGGCTGTSTPQPAPPVQPISVTISPATSSVQVAQSQPFTATVGNDSANKGVTWALSGAGCSGATCGTLSAASSTSGATITFTAPAGAPTPSSVTLTAASVSDTTKTAVATITVTPAAPAIAVSLSQATASVAAGGTMSLTATVTNDSANKGVNWTLAGTGCSGASCGTVAPTSSASGVAVTYTAPVSAPTPPSVTLTATAVGDVSKSAAATITIIASGGAVGVTLTPKRGGLTLGQTLNFVATVTNDVNAAGVTWTATSGTFTGQAPTTATYTAPTSPGSITVTATSVADATKSASATIGVTDLAGVTTYHNDLSRDGVNAQEYALNTTNVTTSTFGKLFSCTADGAIYAQPLWISNVSIGVGTHNVIVAATMRDSVYVFDADASPCVTYWNKQLIPSGETYGSFADVGSSDMYPDFGIVGTPVIDPSSNTIYLVAKTKTTGGTYHQRLHALNLNTGAEAANSPVEIDSSITVPGNCDGGTAIAFNPLRQNQRPGLALVNGVVYVAWGSHGDVNPWHGWVMGFQTGNLTALPAVFNTTPNAAESLAYCEAGIWMAGGAPAAETVTTGTPPVTTTNLYLITGNGVFDGITAFGDSYLKLSTPGLAVLDFFTPVNQRTLDAGDQDVGSSGTALLINQTSSRRLLVGSSKQSSMYVLDRDNMGKFSPVSDAVVQEWAGGGASFSTPGFWNNNLYFFGVQFGSTLPGRSFAFDPSTGLFNTTPTHTTPSAFGFAGATPSISASSATTNGIVWAIDTGAYGTKNGTSRPAGPAILHAFDASNISTELWNSSQAAGGRDTAGNAVKFTVPTVANGKVYIGTRGSDDSTGNGTTFGEIDVYGLLPN